MRRFLHRAALPLLLPPLVALACVDNTVDPDVGEIDFLVGAWGSEDMEMRSQANPNIVVDLVQHFDAEFHLSVAPSGRYQATLSYFGGEAVPEEGTLHVEGDEIVFVSDGGVESRSTYQFQDDRLVLEGQSEFDFNIDGRPEPAILRIVLVFL